MSGLLSSDGKTSSIRVIMFLNTVIAGAVALMGVWRGLDPLALSTLCGVFVVSGIGGKVAQKGKEQ